MVDTEWTDVPDDHFIEIDVEPSFVNKCISQNVLFTLAYTGEKQIDSYSKTYTLYVRGFQDSFSRIMRSLYISRENHTCIDTFKFNVPSNGIVVSRKYQDYMAIMGPDPIELFTSDMFEDYSREVVRACIAYRLKQLVKQSTASSKAFFLSYLDPSTFLDARLFSIEELLVNYDLTEVPFIDQLIAHAYSESK